MRQRDRAICLRAFDYSETSQVVHCLTRAGGVVRLLAKGSKRPKSKTGGPIDLLAEGDLVYSTSPKTTLGTLMEFSESAGRNALHKSEPLLSAGLYMIELAHDLLAEADPHPEVFDLLHSGLERLAASPDKVQQILAYFQWRLLRNIGVLGELKACVACGLELAGAGAAPKEMYFSSIQGGLLCGACEGSAAEKYRLEPATLAAFAVLAAAEAGKKVALDARQAQAANRLLVYHVSHQLGHPPRMARHALKTERS